MPTTDELRSQELPFLRTSEFIEDPESKPSPAHMHLDNQFRLLRKDMLCEMREET
jgi:hypothetical protein